MDDSLLVKIVMVLLARLQETQTITEDDFAETVDGVNELSITLKGTNALELRLKREE